MKIKANILLVVVFNLLFVLMRRAGASPGLSLLAFGPVIVAFHLYMFSMVFLSRRHIRKMVVFRNLHCHKVMVYRQEYNFFRKELGYKELWLVLCRLKVVHSRNDKVVVRNRSGALHGMARSSDVVHSEV